MITDVEEYKSQIGSRLKERIDRQNIKTYVDILKQNIKLIDDDFENNYYQLADLIFNSIKYCNTMQTYFDKDKLNKDKLDEEIYLGLNICDFDPTHYFNMRKSIKLEDHNKHLVECVYDLLPRDLGDIITSYGDLYYEHFKQINYGLDSIFCQLGVKQINKIKIELDSVCSSISSAPMDNSFNSSTSSTFMPVVDYVNNQSPQSSSAEDQSEVVAQKTNQKVIVQRTNQKVIVQRINQKVVAQRINQKEILFTM